MLPAKLEKAPAVVEADAKEESAPGCQEPPE